MADPLVLARAVHLLATILVTGTVFFDALVAGPALAAQASTLAHQRRRSRALLASGLVLAIVSGAAWFSLITSSISDASFADAAWLLATETQFGKAWMLRLALAAVIAVSLVGSSRPRSRWRTGLGLGASAAFAGTLAWSGHGAATPGAAGDLHLAADVLHAVAAAAWLGALLPLALLLGSEGRRDDIALSALVSAVRRFSALGMAAVTMLIASGVINTLFMIDRPERLWTDPYGVALLLKIILFVGMLMLAAHNRAALTPRLATSTNAPARARAAHRLWVHSAIEIALGIAIIVIVAWLGITAPGASAEHVH